MNKRELIEKVAEKNGTSKVEAAKAVNAVIGAMAETLKKGEKISAPLPGLRRGRRRTVDLLVPRCQDREHSLLPEGFSRGQGLQARAELPLDPHDRRCGQFGHRPQLQAHGEALFLGRRRG